MPRFLRYDGIPDDLAQPVRTIINRYELLNDSPLPNTIAVTSSLSGEGTTMVSQALATLLASEHGKSVCWVDCLWMAPDAPPATSGDPDVPGLVEILADESKLLAAIQTSPDLPRLSWLNSGVVLPEKRHTILRSEEFEFLLGLLVDEFDHVIIDSPPLLGSGQGLALLRRSDGYLLVVKQRATSQTQVAEAVEMTAPTPNIGVVLTEYTTKVPAVVRRVLGA